LKERVTPSWHLFEFMDHARMLTGALKELIPACHADLYVGRFCQALPWESDTLLLLSATFHHVLPSHV
jgi:hypothetical protein